MIRQIPRGPFLPFAVGLNVVLVLGAAQFAAEHEQGRHQRPHALCLICWLNKIAPAPEAPSDSGSTEPPKEP